MKTLDTVTALAPRPEPFDPEWSRATLAGIVADDMVRAARRRPRRRLAALVASGLVAVTAGTAVAVGGPAGVVKQVLEDFSKEPNTSGSGLGVLHDPELVARFKTRNGLFAFWLATSSSGTVCYAYSDGQWDGHGVPRKDQLEYGCGGQIYVGPGRAPQQLTRPDQLGGFFKDDAGPILYGVSPYADAVKVRVRGIGVDRTLPLLADSHGYGTDIPEAAGARSLRLTFVDASGQDLGTKSVIAPRG